MPTGKMLICLSIYLINFPMPIWALTTPISSSSLPNRLQNPIISSARGRILSDAHCFRRLNSSTPPSISLSIEIYFFGISRISSGVFPSMLMSYARSFMISPTSFMSPAFKNISKFVCRGYLFIKCHTGIWEQPSFLWYKSKAQYW